MNEYSVTGHERIEKEVKEFGNSAHVTLPNDWTNGTATVILTERPSNKDNNLYQLHIEFANLRNITLSETEQTVLENITEKYDVNTLEETHEYLTYGMNNPSELSPLLDEEQQIEIETVYTKLLTKFQYLYPNKDE